jgi:hypothetical protein
MTCANWILTVLAVVIFIFTMWPEMIGIVAAKWVIGIAVLAILIVAWTGVKCKYCECRSEAKQEMPKKKKR